MYEIEAERINGLEECLLVLHHIPEGDSFEEEMLAHNEIPGMLRMKTLYLNGEKLRQYRVDGCSSLHESLTGQKLSGEDFRRLMSRLFQRIAEGRRYLLREESFVLHPDCLFVRNDTGEPELVYCPEYEKPLTDQVRLLSDILLQYIDVRDSLAVYSGFAFHVLSHENGSTMQRMLTAVSGGPVPGLPEFGGTPDGAGTVLAGEAEIIANGGIYDAAATPRKSSRIRRGIRSFLGGLTVILGMLMALAWAMH